MHITVEDAAKKLTKVNSPFVELFNHGSLQVELYAPKGKDMQKPHSRDEIYVVASGHGSFYNDGDEMKIRAGDFLFVKAGLTHYFFDFSDDFSTWVFFYGPEGGE